MRIFERSKGVCEVEGCNNLVAKNNDLHHKIPEDLRGSREEDNLVMICEKCHNKINKFQRESQVKVCKLLFEEGTKIHIYDFERENEVVNKINDIQDKFFDTFKFKKGKTISP